MNDATDFDADTDAAARRSNRSSMIAGGLALAWFIVLCVAPDPRPLGAPEWAVDGVRSIAGVSEATARVVATVAFRAAGLGILGVLLALSLKRLRLRWAAPLTLGLALLLAVAAKRINFGYFPTNPQLQLIVAAAILGALAGLALRRSRIAIAALVILAAGLFAWGASRGVPDDVYEAARATGLHVLEYADEVPSGDEGFLPPVTDLPEDIPRDAFQTEFGGLGGAETRRLFDEIDRRLATREALR